MQLCSASINSAIARSVKLIAVAKSWSINCREMLLIKLSDRINFGDFFSLYLSNK
ncbi:hypothetical protein [Nostoc sp.]|uniref:hypothetical protein n=1 Tax=Nostoc sp. TaxID=1180 RepID=UPI002FFA825A